MLASLRQLTEMVPPLTGELEVLERALPDPRRDAKKI